MKIQYYIKNMSANKCLGKSDCFISIAQERTWRKERDVVGVEGFSKEEVLC